MQQEKLDCRTVSSYLCVRPLICLFVAVISSCFGAIVQAADNELTVAEKNDGWMLLFNGRELSGWKNNNGQPVQARIEDNAMNVHGSGGYLLVYDKPFADFVFRCDVKMDQPSCNSGIFLRVGDLEDPVQTGIEVQIESEVEPSLHSFAAFYDLVAPAKNATRGPGKWDSVEVRCEGARITVTVNGEEVNSINCEEWDQPGRRLDGTRHKFRQAIKDFPRQGYLGLQDHGHDVWYKNIKIKKL